MSYNSLSDLPANAPRELPAEAKVIYQAAYRKARSVRCCCQPDRDGCAMRTAWAAVLRRYQPDVYSGTWVRTN